MTEAERCSNALTPRIRWWIIINHKTGFQKAVYIIVNSETKESTIFGNVK